MQDSTHRLSLFGANLLALLVLVGVGGSVTAQAQAIPGASRTADVAVFGGFTNSNPDFGPHNNNGFTIGADYTRFFGWRIAPTFEIRAGYNSGDVVSQKTILGGLRLGADLHRFHPYANALFGGNKIDFKVLPDPGLPSYNYDESFTTSYGGGIDVDAYRNFQVKVDYQFQSSNYGGNGLQPHNADFTLAPTFLTIGVVYHLPFGGGLRRH
jgi:hypothetical protein